MLLTLKWRHRFLRKVLLPVSLFVSLNGAAQSFSFSFQRASLAKVFDQIEQRSSYRFLYSEEVLALGNPVSFTVSNAPLDSILRLCFYQQPLGYSIEGKHIIVRKKIIEKPVPLTRELRERWLTPKMNRLRVLPSVSNKAEWPWPPMSMVNSIS